MGSRLTDRTLYAAHLRGGQDRWRIFGGLPAAPLAPHLAAPYNVGVHDLSTLGFGPFFEDQLRGWVAAGVIPARIAAFRRSGEG